MNIRNFCIIAHIDHWKSTLADRMLEITGTVRKVWHWQMLDTMELEQERWITIKLTPARMHRKGYEFNLIDTPWHADFQYEVSRSLAAVEWVILLIDASQGIQAQTLSTLYMAMDLNLEIIPVLNKIDLPAADPQRVWAEIENLLWIPQEDIIWISAKTWVNVDKVLDRIISHIPEPKTYPTDEINTALIFDSVYDQYKWVVVYVKVIQGSFSKWDAAHLVYTQTEMTPTEVGFLSPVYNPDKKLSSWQIWYIVTGKKSVRDAKIWDTILLKKWLIKQEFDNLDLTKYAVAWFKKALPFVFAGVYPLESSDYDKLKESFAKLVLNDSAIEFTHENSKALGFGFRSGFLWMLHMDIIKERLEREYDMETIFTTPTVSYLVKSKSLSLDIIKEWKNIADLLETWLRKYVLFHETQQKSELELKEDILSQHEKTLQPWIVVRSWADMIDKWLIEELHEPYADVEIVWPEWFAWNIMAQCQEYRWQLLHMEHLDQTRVIRKYAMPLWEIIIDFYDRLKSATKWFATMHYEFKNYQPADLVKLDVFINWEIVEAFSLVVHKDKAYYVWRDLVSRLKTLIPKHMFTIPIQAWIWTKIIARETIWAMRKDVIAKCYGWDISRKKKMKAMWNVNVPSDVFIKMVTREN